MFRNLALRPKLVLIIMLVSAVALLLMGIGVVCFDVISLRYSLSHDLTTVAEILGDNSTSALAFGDNRAAAEVLSALQAEPRVIAACIYSYDGIPFAKYVRPGRDSTFTPPPIRRESNSFESGRLMQFHEIKLRGAVVGTLYIESDLGEIRQRLRNYTIVVGLVMLISSLLAYGLASRLQRMFSSPVLALVRTAEQISKENNYALRATTSGNDEFGVLVTAFNGMLGQIQRRDQELEFQQAELQREVEGRTAINLQLKAAKGLAESANKAKSEFLANMSHEIRTPINGILGMIELALGTELSAEQREYLAMVRSSGESLLAIINDILDFSKVESGKLEIESIVFNLHGVVGETMKMLAVRADQQNLELLCDIDPEVPADVVGDPGRLRQILINLVGNAVKFTATGEVLVEITKLPRPSPSQVEIQFKVTDTGIGVPYQKQALLFQAFHQADGSITRKYGGTGLGLAISARLAELMGGKIWIESGTQKGSTFCFTASFSIPETQSTPPLRVPPELLGARLLVVDDNASCRQIIHRTTLRWKMRPVAVGSVASAIEALKISQTEKDPFRMVLLDARLPGINRLDFNSNPRNLAGISTGTILMLPSKAPAADMDHLDESAADSYLFKPILATELLQALTSLVEPPSRQGETIPVDTTEISQAATNLNILVAEDNPINQALLLRLLQKMGHSSALARNGREALELVRIHKFDLILMDVQMPEVDGLTAATAIREAEKSTGGHMPIFAITARAMKGDRELCLQAGMDGYIAKPISFKDVEKALATVLPRAATFPQAPPWSGDLALKRLGGDQELLRELCSLFLIESPKLLLKLKHAVGQGDAEAVHHAAHSIKGELGCLGAEHAMDLAKRLEIMAQESDLKEAKKLLQELDAQVLQLYTEVKEKMGVYQ